MLPAQLDRSKVSGSSLSPDDLCHPTLHRVPFTAEGWLFELKHDGFRAFARAGTVELMSRWGRSMAPAFPEIVQALESLPTDAVLDAELVVPNWPGALIGKSYGVARLCAGTPCQHQVDVSGASLPWVACLKSASGPR
jgi:hypothetical protein